MDQNVINWQVLVAIVAIIGILAVILKPLINLNTILIKLDMTIEDLKKQLDKNEKSHEDIFCKLDEHENRIDKLEN